MQEMPYYALKQECNKAGLSSKGNRETLLQRLGQIVPTDQPKLPEPEITAKAPTPAVILPATPEELQKYLPGATFAPKVDTSKYAAWLTEDRLKELEYKLAPIAASRGSFNFSINHKGAAFQVEFFGGDSGPESTTLIDTDAQIVARARHYFTARMARGTNGQVSRL